MWCYTYLARLILAAGDKLWNQPSLHMLKGQWGLTHSSIIAIISKDGWPNRYPTLSAIRLLKEVIFTSFPPRISVTYTVECAFTRLLPRGCVQTYTQTHFKQPEPKQQTSCIWHLNSADYGRQLQQHEWFCTGFLFSHCLLISPAPSGVPFWTRFDFPHSYIYLS